MKVEAGNKKATIYWSIERASSQPISGYNIYLTDSGDLTDTLAWKENPNAPYNPVPYPGDTKGDIYHQSFPLENLVNGMDYYVLVRTIGIGGAMSKSSNVVGFMPLARGYFIITPEHSRENGGFSFDNEKSVSAYDPSCDIYLYATENKIGLSSPNRLTPGMRKSSFSKSVISSLLDDTIIISKGDTFTVLAKNGSAYLKVESIEGRYPDISVRITYVYYQTIRK